MVESLSRGFTKSKTPKAKPDFFRSSINESVTDIPKFTDKEFELVDAEFGGVLTHLLDGDTPTLDACGFTDTSVELRKWSIAFVKCTVPQIDKNGRQYPFGCLRDFAIYVFRLVTKFQQQKREGENSFL